MTARPDNVQDDDSYHVHLVYFEYLLSPLTDIDLRQSLLCHM